MPAIYHLTNIENVLGILRTRELRCNRIAPTAIDVSDHSIKLRRERKLVPCGPGGTIGDYVPFHFAPRSPMLFRIHQRGVDGVRYDQERIIYLVSSSEAVLDAGYQCVLADGNAAAAPTIFYDDPSRLEQVVDWPLMKERYWSNRIFDHDRVRRRGAELLVRDTVPLELIAEVGVYDRATQRAVSALVDGTGCDVAVRVRPDWYF